MLSEKSTLPTAFFAFPMAFFHYTAHGNRMPNEMGVDDRPLNAKMISFFSAFLTLYVRKLLYFCS